MAAAESRTWCDIHNADITGYKWVMDFIIVDGYRHQTTEQCRMSCGCVIEFPDIAFDDESSETVAAPTIVDAAGQAVMTILDTMEMCDEDDD